MVANVTLDTRRDCHLCDEARAMLADCRRRLHAEVREVDVDSNAVLVERFGDSIPVIVIEWGAVLLWPFTRAAVRAAVQRGMQHGNQR